MKRIKCFFVANSDKRILRRLIRYYTNHLSTLRKKQLSDKSLSEYLDEHRLDCGICWTASRIFNRDNISDRVWCTKYTNREGSYWFGHRIVTDPAGPLAAIERRIQRMKEIKDSL